MKRKSERASERKREREITSWCNFVAKQTGKVVRESGAGYVHENPSVRRTARGVDGCDLW